MAGNGEGEGMVMVVVVAWPERNQVGHIEAQGPKRPTTLRTGDSGRGRRFLGS